MKPNPCTFDVLCGSGLGTAQDASAFDRYRDQLDLWAYASVTDKPISYEDYMSGAYYAADKIITADATAYLAATNGAFTRASGGAMLNSAGKLVEFAPNVPRITDRGVLVDAGGTNLIRNPRCEGAVVGSPGALPTYHSWSTSLASGLSFSIAGSGTENGVPYIDLHIEGTASDTSNWRYFFETVPGPVTGDSVTFTHSAFLKVVSGNINTLASISLRLSNYNGSGAALASTKIFIPIGSLSANLARFDQSGTTVEGTLTSNPCIEVGWNAGAVINVTIRIGAPQLVIASFATSIILPPVGSPAQATRTADRIVTTRSSPVLALSKVIHGWTASGISVGQALWQIDDGTTNNRVYIARASSGNLYLYSIIDGVARSINLGALGNNVRFGLACRIASNDFSISLNGAAVITNTDMLMPPGLVYERLGHSVSNGEWCGVIRENHEFPTILSNAKLQSLSVLA